MTTSSANELFDPTTEFGARIAEGLEREQIVWLTTVGPTGTPEPNPVWFRWDGNSFLIFSRPDRPKLRNIARNPRVALHFDSTESGGEVVVFGGGARLEATVDPDEAAAYLEKYAEGLNGLSMTGDRFRAEYSVPIRVVPDRLRGF
ncbi:TIGR03667 family PPOX class F420-dependent oxidoreductase [Nocardia sp. NBC_01329]|uniref:TIGR03667 family PPOX class F420-dependent oxidoreductase n=1 Tax=Nocardia sp. NBC_01329 TaxID=2903594 RepID=UPI002E156905|nr:TIGR03667 family PPOX class F420-dependent oxidoreductase [Nocardia sp. NBC_01329]